MSHPRKVSWEGMTRGEIWRALLTAPQIAGRWESNGDDDYTRWSPIGKMHIVACVGKVRGPLPPGVERYWTWRSQGNVGDAPTKEIAMECADEALRKEGWLVIENEDDDQ